MRRILAVLVLSSLFVAARGQEQSAQMVQFLKEFPQRASFNSHSYEFIDVTDTPLSPVKSFLAASNVL